MFQLTHKQLLELVFWTREMERDKYAAERKKLEQYLQTFLAAAIDSGFGNTSHLYAEQYLQMFNAVAMSLYCWLGKHVLEIGPGPYWGLLQWMREWPSVERCVAVDPLFPAYGACGLLEERGSILRVDEPFEYWDCDSEQFDSIISTNSLDHGEMGFYLLPKVARLLRPGGHFLLHVHFRPKELLNLLHDHQLTADQLARSVADAGLVEEWCEILPKDIDGQFCEAVIGIWRKPECQ